MPNRCTIIDCRGNAQYYNGEQKCRLFRLPQGHSEANRLLRHRWIDALPRRDKYKINPKTFRLCEKHWPDGVSLKKLPGGYTRPDDPPSIFNVPPSCLSSPKAPPRQPKNPDKFLEMFTEQDKIKDFASFKPDERLLKESKEKCMNTIISRSNDKFVCIFMSDDYSKCEGSIVVYNKSTLTSPLTMKCFRKGIQLSNLSTILNKNNGISTYSQFFEIVNRVKNEVPSFDSVLEQVTGSLRDAISYASGDKLKKVEFLVRQLELLNHKAFTTADYCHALELFPRCSYDHLRDYLVLPCRRKMEITVSATDLEKVLIGLFKKVTQQNNLQRYSFLLIDEVKIRPTVSFAGGVLSGMASNDPSVKATSMLGVLMKCLHGGPSVMISVTPVHKLTAKFKYDLVVQMAALVEKCGGIVAGSITDNHKINQNYCTLFPSLSVPFKATHPLDKNRVWYLLFDPVHILKCIRNNWISEKCKTITLDGVIVGCFDDVRSLYAAEKGNILKTTPLTHASVYPSNLQLQNVQHVLNVFNEKVVAALRLSKKHHTADFIEQILTWWKIQNVSSKGQDSRMRDPSRAVQTKDSTNLQPYLDLFTNAQSGDYYYIFICFTTLKIEWAIAYSKFYLLVTSLFVNSLG